MAGRWRDPSAFRADRAAAPSARPSRRQSVALLAVLVLVAGAITVASYLVRPDRARAFDLYHGSLFLADEQSPVAVDLATGKPTLRLVGAAKQVGITGADQLGVVPLDGGTLLLNRRTGEFNMVNSSGFVVKHDGGGVPLVGTVGATSTAIGVAAHQLAYVVRNGPDRTDVFLVSQATVTAAINATGTVTPRASAAFTDGPVETGSGGAVSADDSLWALVQTGPDTHVVRRFDYPQDSNPGVRLSATDHGQVTGPVALGVAAAPGGAPTGSGASAGTTAVAYATADRITIVAPTATSQSFTPPAGVTTEILPATSTTNQFAFLMRTATGWSLASVNADGSGLRAPRPLRGLPPLDPMAQPAFSEGSLYTLDQRTGVTYRIGLDGAVTAVSLYPIAMVGTHAAELTAMSDGYVIARGSRVIVNSGTHANALILFTDGSRPPLPIAKSSAVQVNAAGGAEELTRPTVKTVQPPRQTGGGAKPPRAAPVQVVNPHLDCADVSQKPHIPTIDSVQPGSRSVTIHWTYPIIDRTQDCFPTSYLVEVRTVSPGGPDAPKSATVVGQNVAQIADLFPLTRYEIRVTAIIHGQGTPSSWVPVRTAEEGPAAPTDVAVTTDSAGNWVLHWNGCGGVGDGCVPVESWTVTPSFCDGRGLSAPPAPLNAPADSSARSQPAFTYPGSDALLGRGLQFVITGSSTTQVPGRPSAPTACAASWTPPSAAAMTLTASKPANSALGGTTSTTARLDLGANPTRAVGGVGARIQFTLTGPDATRVDTQAYDGVGSSITASFTGLRAGATYQVSVTVAAPGHPAATVQLGPQPVTPAADWPDVGLSARCDPEGPVVQLNCAFTANVSGISSAAVGGETFDVIDTADTQSGIRCGNAFRSLARTGIDPATPITDDLSLLTFTGNCTVTLVLRENGPVFGGTLKTISTQYSVQAATTYTAKAKDWDVEWDPNQTSSSQALISYQGTDYTVAQLKQITQNWSATVRGPDGQSCGSWSGNDPPAGVDVPATGSCVNQFGGRGGWSVDISYQDVGTGTGHDVPGAHNLNGPPPTYQPCTPTDFGAQWSGTQDNPTITLTVGPKEQLAGCSNWDYAVIDSGGESCPATVDGGPDSVTITPTCGTEPSSDPAWTVRVSWSDPAGNAQGPQDVPVTGDPPQ